MVKIVFLLSFFASFVLAVGPVLKTGQTKSYDANGTEVTDGSIKDDGYYQAGQARSYSQSSARVVADNVTGLQWQDDVVNENVTKNWSDAKTFCTNSAMDGRNDWRLPTIEELETLFDAGYNGPSIVPNVFSHTALYYYWSVTSAVYDNSKAWKAYFDYNEMLASSKTSASHVRCVRGGQLLDSNFSRDVNSGIVIDSATDLQWQDNYSDNSNNIKDANWTEAINYCENLSLGGYTDWRLPNENELLSIVDRSRYYPAIDPVFQKTITSYYWSSTSDNSNASRAYYVYFYYGNLESFTYGAKTSAHYVRCVRGGQVDHSTAATVPIMYYLLN